MSIKKFTHSHLPTCIRCGTNEVWMADHPICFLYELLFECGSYCEKCDLFPAQKRQLYELYEDVFTKLSDGVRRHIPCTEIYHHPDFVQGVIDRGTCDPQRLWDVMGRVFRQCNFTSDSTRQKAMRAFLAVGCHPPPLLLVDLLGAQLIECVTTLHDWGMVFDDVGWKTAVAFHDHAHSDEYRMFLRELLKRTGFCATIQNTLDDPLSPKFLCNIFTRLTVVRDVLDVPDGENYEAWRALVDYVHAERGEYVHAKRRNVRNLVRRVAAKMVDAGYPLPPLSEEQRSNLLRAITPFEWERTYPDEENKDDEIIAKIREYLR